MNKTTDTRPATDLEDQFYAAMNSAVLVDRSAAGKIRVTGADRLDLLHRMSTNDLLGLAPYSAKGTVFTNEKGRILDYVRVLVYPEYLLLITSPAREFIVRDWIDKYTIMEDIQTSIVTTELAMYSVIGPETHSSVQTVFSKVPSRGKFSLDNIGNAACTLDIQSEFGTEWFNIVLPQVAGAAPLIPRLLSESAPPPMMTEDAYECYRIMLGMPQGGKELMDSFNPYETHLRHAISFTKGCYIGQEVIARLDTYQKIQRRLVRLNMEGAAGSGDTPLPIVRESEEIGVLTSVAPHPLNGQYLGLGVVRQNKGNVGDMVEVKGTTSTVMGSITAVFE